MHIHEKIEIASLTDPVTRVVIDRHRGSTYVEMLEDLAIIQTKRAVEAEQCLLKVQEQSASRSVTLTRK